MNRELKFRAWCLDNKWMDDYFFVQSNGVAHDTPSKTHDTPNIEIEESPNLIVMQFTGLQDKNGKDIYEGDLLLVKDIRICEVLFHKNAGCWDIEPRNILSSLPMGAVCPASYKYHAEIIGNIYENPDLLACNNNPIE